MTRPTTLLLALALALGVAPSAEAHTRAHETLNDWLDHAWSAKAKGDYAGAEEAFLHVLENGDDEKKQLAALELGYVMLRVDRPEKAFDYFEVAATVGDEERRQQAREALKHIVGLMSEKALDAEATGLPHEADEWMARALEYDARRGVAASPFLLLQRAYLHLWRGDGDAARAAFEEVIAADDGELGQRAKAELAYIVDHPPPPAVPRPPEDELLDAANKARAEGRLADARVALKEAAAAGVPAARIALEEAYVMLLDLNAPERVEARVAASDWTDAEIELLSDIRVRFTMATGSDDEAIAALAKLELESLPTPASLRAQQAAAGGDFERARELLVGATAEGWSLQRVELGLAYLGIQELGAESERLRDPVAWTEEDFAAVDRIRGHLLNARTGPDARLRHRAAEDDAGLYDTNLVRARKAARAEPPDPEAAIGWYETAREQGAPTELVDMELAYLWLNLEAAARAGIEELGEEPDPDALAELETAAKEAQDNAQEHLLAVVRDDDDELLYLQSAQLHLGWIAVSRTLWREALDWFEQARVGQAAPLTRAALYGLGYVYASRNQLELAEARWEEAAADPDPDNADDAAYAELARKALDEMSTRWLGRAMKRDQDGDVDGAREDYERARLAGADPQVVALYRGFMEKRIKRYKEARVQLRIAADGEDPEMADQAAAELSYLPRVAWGDLYLEGFGQARILPTRGFNFVPTLRVRGYLHPIAVVPIDAYIFVQITRDSASISETPTGLPLIYADNTLMLGGGLLARLWKNRIGIYAQLAAAYSLIRSEPERERWELDFRIGAYLGLQLPGCTPDPQLGKPGARWEKELCAELYSELTYVSRFDHNLFFMARGRVGLHYLVTGPVAWAPMGEVRLFKDLDNDYYNNLIDFGVLHRWRLLTPFGLDLSVGLHAGTYFGLENVDPAPDPLAYLDFRFLLATYIVF